MVSRIVQLSSFTILLVVDAVLADECIKHECDKTQLIPATENHTIELQPCDVCTECPASEPQTVQAWWYYKWPNGSRTDDLRATVQGRAYMIDLLGHPSLVSTGEHKIYTNYMYLCDGVPGVLRDIEITLTPVDVTIECPNKMPVPEGSSVVIWCETGLSDSQLVQVVFKFWGREGTCPSVHVDDGHSSWTVKRNESEPYTCGLHIDNIQPSDSGDYYCDVNLPGTLTVRSDIVHVEVASEPTNLGINVPLILETTIPGGIMLILIVLTVPITVTCIVHHRNRNRQGPHHQDDRNRLLPRNPQAQVYGASGSTAASSNQSGRLEESRSSQASSGSSSQPNELDGDQLTNDGRESEATEV